MSGDVGDVVLAGDLQPLGMFDRALSQRRDGVVDERQLQLAVAKLEAAGE